jgi:hypothetical protein
MSAVLRFPKGTLVTVKTLHLLLGLGVAAAFPAVARAQDDLESLITASQQVESGMTLARRQIGETDLPGALGTLERLLFIHPEAVPARLLYASLLCRLDDRLGAEVELGLLGGQPIADPDWAEVSAACGSVQRPAPRKRKK